MYLILMVFNCYVDQNISCLNSIGLRFGDWRLRTRGRAASGVTGNLIAGCFIGLINHVIAFDYIGLLSEMGKKYQVFWDILQIFLQVRSVTPNITTELPTMKSAHRMNA